MHIFVVYDKPIDWFPKKCVLKIMLECSKVHSHRMLRRTGSRGAMRCLAAKRTAPHPV